MPAIPGVPVPAASTGPCQPWEPAVGCPLDVPGASQDLLDSSLMAATEVLWALSGRRYGLCDILVRPGCQSCFASWTAWSPWDGGWRSTCPMCDCYGLTSDLILDGPVETITEVQVDGEILVNTAYTLFNRRILTRLDGFIWPSVQRFDLPDGAVGTWSVAYSIGAAVPELGRRAVTELAGEMAKACIGSACALPARITDLTRQGVSMRFIDPQEFLREGRTGLYLSDLFITTHNPAGLPQRSRVYSVDTSRSRVPTA